MRNDPTGRYPSDANACQAIIRRATGAGGVGRAQGYFTLISLTPGSFRVSAVPPMSFESRKLWA